MPESALKMGHLSDKTEEKQAGAGESARAWCLLWPPCPLISAAVGLPVLYQSAGRSAPGGLIAPAGGGSPGTSAVRVSLAYPVANAATSGPPLPLRAVDDNGLTEGTGATWWALPTSSARRIPLFVPFTGKTVCDKGTQI